MRATALILILGIASAPSFARGTPLDLQTVSATQTRQDLGKLAKVLEKYHPYLKSQKAREHFETRVKSLDASVHGEIPLWKDWLLQQKLFRTLDDPHTTTYPIVLERRILPVRVRWVSDGILVSPWHNKSRQKLFPKNSQLLRLGPYDPRALLHKQEALFPGPEEWVKVSNAHVLTGYQMYWLGLVGANGGVPITVRTPAGKVRHLTVNFVTLPKGWFFKKIRQEDRSWYHWSIDRAHNVGWFTLNQMRITPGYEKAVSAFFNAVERAHITRVVVDLRKNGGGASLAAVPFMEYMGVKHYQDYSHAISLTPKALKSQFGKLEAYLKKNMPRDYAANLPIPQAPSVAKRFHGKLYLATGPGCFSSAMEFAADVKYNHVGKIIGRPCGETVTGPGEVHEFVHDSPSGVPFQVSTKIEKWPGLPNGTVVEPDIRIPITIKDVRKGVDPVRAWFDASAPHS